jgi:hypothetical protein
VAEARRVLAGEDHRLRPRDEDGLPGGLLDLPDLPVVILPDLHGRADFLAAVLAWRPPLGGAGARLADLLGRGEAILLSLGDAFHSEGRDAALRWALAAGEYASGWRESPAMDEEMGRALACVELILRAKAAFPSTFHYLKGNHDNVTNEEGRGDHPFYKYAAEGEMTASWFRRRYGRDLAEAYRAFELDLPLVARGARFVASHAEPAFALSPADIIAYRRRPEVAEALTWTANDCAEAGSVGESLAALLGGAARGSRWFGGHRPVDGPYALRQGGFYVQFHRPDRRNLVLIRPGEEPDPDRAVRCL